MTDKQYEAQKKRVIKYWNKWFKPMGINWWWVDRTWDRARDMDSPATAARTESNWEYRTAEITFYLPALEDLTDEQLEEVIVHEFVHVLSMAINNFETEKIS